MRAQGLLFYDWDIGREESGPPPVVFLRVTPTMVLFVYFSEGLHPCIIFGVTSKLIFPSA